jgi:RNA polymerase sigma-70 factor (ECF subfamily)
VARTPHNDETAAPAKPRAPTESPLRLVRSDESNFSDALYARLAPVVNKLLWALLGPDPERDYLAHEIFIRILRGAGRVRDQQRLEAWAARVTVNLVKNEFRSRKLRRLLTFGVDEDELWQVGHPDFEGRELLLRTYGVLMKLPTAERLPFTLRLMTGHSIEEIALACGSSVRTTKRRLKAARERFVRLGSADSLLAERLRQANFDGGGDA